MILYIDFIRCKNSEGTKINMNEKTMNLINKILYYIVAPILILEFILSDMHIISFTKILFIASVVILLVLCAIAFFYKKKHPDYEFKVNEMYTRILFVIILLECFYSAGFFKW